ncbi:MAG: hypothetical protein NDJ94_13005 [Vicinamibacteria bacterium]|nr:hypothetical protein [Vicinamibacteria bacterium]
MTWEAFATVRDIVTAKGSCCRHVDRLVALAIADHLGASGTAWPSLARLSTWTGLGQTAIKAAIHRLCQGPERIFDLEPGGSMPGQARRANRYRIAARPGRHTTGSPDDHDRVAARLLPGREATSNVLRTSKRTSQPARASETERRRKDLEALPMVATVAEAYRENMGRKSATLGMLEAARRGLDAGATVEDLQAIARAVGLAQQTPTLAPRGGLLAWAVQHAKLDAAYLFRPDNVDKLAADAEAVLRAGQAEPAPVAIYADRPLDEVPFHERAREAARREAGAA